MLQSFDNLKIDYSRHPAFQSHAIQTHYDDSKIASLVKKIDSKMEVISSQYHSSLSELRSIFKAKILRLVDELDQLVAPHIPTDLSKAHWARSIKQIREELFAEVRQRNRTLAYDISKIKMNRTANSEGWIKSLQRDGIIIVPPTDDVEPVVRAGLSFRQQLEVEHKKNPHGRVAYAIPPAEPIWKLFADYLENNGLFVVASAYMRCPIDLLYLSIELSNEDQTWYKNCYQDAGIPTSKTAYYHYDYDIKLIKAMIYLNDVTKENGAFSYVKGSNTWSRSIFLTWLYRIMDMQAHEVFGYDNNAYYRCRFSDPKLRPHLMALPALFRGTSHFGDDLQDGDPLLNDILQQQVIAEGKAGSFVLFDGGRGLHRGGLVNSGERLAIQIAFGVTDDRTLTEKVAHKVNRGLAKVRRKLHV